MFCCLVVVGFVNCFVIVCNMSQKVFKDYLEKKKSRLLRACFAGFMASLRAGLGLLVYAFFCEHYICNN